MTDTVWNDYKPRKNAKTTIKVVAFHFVKQHLDIWSQYDMRKYHEVKHVSRSSVSNDGSF